MLLLLPLSLLASSLIYTPTVLTALRVPNHNVTSIGFLLGETDRMKYILRKRVEDGRTGH